METKRSSSLISLLKLIVLPIISSTIPCLCEEAQNDSSCYDIWKPFSCGNISFSFPFSPDETFGLGPCARGLPGYQITCDPNLRARLTLGGRSYRVTDLYSSANLTTVVDDQLISDLKLGSCESLQNISIPTLSIEIVPLKLPSLGVNLTFFKCPYGLNISRGFRDLVLTNYNYNCSDGDRLFLLRNLSQLSPVETPSRCKVVAIPVSSASLSRYGFLNRSEGERGLVLLDDSGFRNSTKLVDVLSDGFPLQWPPFPGCDTCQRTGGRCGFNSNTGKVVCFGKGGFDRVKVKHKQLKSWKLIVGVVTGSCSVLVAIVLLLIFKCGRRASAIFKTSYFKKNETAGGGIKAKEFIENYRSTLLTNYSYNDIKKMTNGFKDKLGKGGYGSVYKGNLLNGRIVAVKVLEKSNDISCDFINEVTTIGTIYHLNVIRLLGFCWDHSKQALIYEYMANGSLADLLSKEGENHLLGLARLLEIALGVAHGIEYLHNGCGSRILHLDIKPQNVLLDQNFNPKISDFGLAKVYSRSRSAVSMTAARGTIGYIAPEIFLRNFGNPSHKSDVYSYGMLLLEMVVGIKHEAPKMNTSSEAYFPVWIYDKLIEEQNLELVDSVVPEEDSIARKMVMVGLWCIQMDPRDRPSMTRVVEMLSGSVEAIEMPPKRFSFPRVQFEQESNSTESNTSDLPFTFESHVT